MMKRYCVGMAFLAALGFAAACSSGGSTSSGTTTSGSGGSGGSGGGLGGQKLAIGSPCKADADCGGSDFMCMTDHPDGYCIKMCDIKNVDADCPSGSVCQYDGVMGECHQSCDTGADCRAGYECAPAASDPDNTVSHAFCDMAEMTDAGPG